MEGEEIQTGQRGWINLLKSCIHSDFLFKKKKKKKKSEVVFQDSIPTNLGLQLSAAEDVP